MKNVPPSFKFVLVFSTYAFRSLVPVQNFQQQ
jgi:hypothetical protein